MCTHWVATMFNIRRTILKIKNGITLEPAIFVFHLGINILLGAQIQTDLLMWKVCTKELNYTEDICANLTTKENDAFNNEVQEKANGYLMVISWLRSAPALIFSLFAGSLLDVYGCKIFIVLPLVGVLVSDVGVLLNYVFIDALPIEFFYIESIFSFFGGIAVYYLGIYGYGSLISNDESRASLLARYDGFEVMAAILGKILSPIILTYIGKYGNFGFKILLTTSALVYLLAFVKNTPTPEKSNKLSKVPKNPLKLIRALVLDPILHMCKAVFKRRQSGTHFLIWLQYLMYAACIFIIEEGGLKYLYMLKTFEGFNAVQYSVFSTVVSVGDSVGLLFILPVLSKKLKIHDALLYCLVLSSESLGLLASAFCSQLWQFYLAHGVQLLGMCKYALVRALLRQFIDPEETGRMFSALAICASLVFLVSNPVFRKLYNYTLATFPAAEILLASAILAVTSALALVIYFQQRKIKKQTNNNDALCLDKVPQSPAKA